MCVENDNSAIPEAEIQPILGKRCGLYFVILRGFSSVATPHMNMFLLASYVTTEIILMKKCSSVQCKCVRRHYN